jgi:hypothetical protein
MDLRLTIATLFATAAQRTREAAAEVALSLGSQLMVWGLFARPNGAPPTDGARAVEAVRARCGAHPAGLRGVVAEDEGRAETCCGAQRTAIVEGGAAGRLGCLRCGSEVENTLPSLPFGVRLVARERWAGHRAGLPGGTDMAARIARRRW